MDIRHLRVYAIKTSKGKIIVLCGYKNKQTKDIRTFRSLKRRYLEHYYANNSK